MARTAGGVVISRWVLFLCIYIDRPVVFHNRPPHSRIGAHTTEKPGCSLWRGEIQKEPGLTIDQIVVSKRTQRCTPNGISLYAKWLLLGELPRNPISRSSATEPPLPPGPLYALLRLRGVGIRLHLRGRLGRFSSLWSHFLWWRGQRLHGLGHV